MDMAEWKTRKFQKLLDFFYAGSNPAIHKKKNKNNERSFTNVVLRHSL